MNRWFALRMAAARYVIPGALIAVVSLLVLPPIVLLLKESLVEYDAAGIPGGATLANYVRLLTSPRLYSSALNSLIFASLATLVSLAVGGLVAWVVERTNSPFKTLAYLTSIISLGTPYILYVTGWLYLFGKIGPLNDLYKYFAGPDAVLNIHSMWGMILVEGFLWSPLVFLLLSTTFKAANAEMEDAARMSGASTFEVIWHIGLKLALPGILAMAIFVFIRNIESFDVPVLIGTPGRINLLTTDIYFSVKKLPPQTGHASAFSVTLLVLVAALLYLYSRVSKESGKYASITGKGYRPRLFDLGKFRWLGGGLIITNFLIVLVLPMLALVWTALMPFPRGIRFSSIGLASLKHFETVLTSPSYIQLGIRTILIAAVTATVAVGFTVLAGWWAARRRPGGALIDQLATMPLVFPGIVLGVAMMEIALRLPFGLYGSIWLIALAFIIRYLPYGMRYSYTGVLQIHRELEEAAGVAGAGEAGTFVRIVVPLLLPAILSGWLFIFLIAAKELSMAVLLSGPDSQVMAVAMFDLWSNGQGGELAALGLIWALLMTIVASCFYYVAYRRAAQRAG